MSNHTHDGAALRRKANMLDATAIQSTTSEALADRCFAEADICRRRADLIERSGLERGECLEDGRGALSADERAELGRPMPSQSIYRARREMAVA